MESLPSIEEIPIRETGSYFDTDSEGYLVNPASIEKIQPDWKPVMEDIVERYKLQFGDRLAAVYVRGSVARGEAIAGVSDIDTFAFVNLPEESIPKGWATGFEEELKEKYPFLQGAELNVDPIAAAQDDALMVGQSVCVYGTAIEVPRVRVDAELALRSLRGVPARLDQFAEWLTQDDSEEEVRNGCTWFMKFLLRAGFALTIPKAGLYTRDLYRCYETFAKYYPEQEPQMKEVLRLALNPTSAKEKLKELYATFGQWMRNEAQKELG